MIPQHRNLEFYEPREITVEFRFIKSAKEVDDLCCLAIMKSKLLNVIDILNRMRPRALNFGPEQQQSLKIRFAGDCWWWIKRFPLVYHKDMMRRRFYQFLLLPLIPHWAWKDAKVDLPLESLYAYGEHFASAFGDIDDAEIPPGSVDLDEEILDPKSTEVIRDGLIWTNSVEGEKALLEGNMFLPPDMTELHLRHRQEKFEREMAPGLWKTWEGKSGISFGQ